LRAPSAGRCRDAAATVPDDRAWIYTDASPTATEVTAVAVIDYREIPSAKGGQPDEDAWAFFARDFLAALGLDVEQGPGRGADAGRDLIVVENHKGPLTSHQVRWVVSCKHYAHADKAVPDRDEPDPVGRVRKFRADGFMAFYSTLPSATLNDTFHRLQQEARIVIYDAAAIEAPLLSDPRLRPLLARYFPVSHARSRRDVDRPVDVWGRYTPLSCVGCGKDLLTTPRKAMVGFVKALDDRRQYVDVYWACKGECDRHVQARYPRMATGWRDVSDLMIPLIFMRFVMAMLNQMRQATVFSDVAFENVKTLILILSQVAMRNTSDEQREQIAHLDMLPEFF
jgi:hypothetical protein